MVGQELARPAGAASRATCELPRSLWDRSLLRSLREIWKRLGGYLDRERQSRRRAGPLEGAFRPGAGGSVPAKREASGWRFSGYRQTATPDNWRWPHRSTDRGSGSSRRHCPTTGAPLRETERAL